MNAIGNIVDSIRAGGLEIGIAGGGANYANRSIRRRMHPDVLASEAHAVQRRTFALPQMGRFLETAQDPPVDKGLADIGEAMTRILQPETLAQLPTAMQVRLQEAVAVTMNHVQWCVLTAALLCFLVCLTIAAKRPSALSGSPN